MSRSVKYQCLQHYEKDILFDENEKAQTVVFNFLVYDEHFEPGVYFFPACENCPTCQRGIKFIEDSKTKKTIGHLVLICSLYKVVADN